MRKRTLSAGLVIAGVAAAVPAAGLAVTTQTTTPRIEILGGASFVPNRYIQDKMRFGKDVYALRAGSTIQIRSKTPQEPHTVSVVRKSDFPKTVKGLEACYKGGVCGKLEKAHGAPENGEGPPKFPLVNKGKTGLDTEGDSIVVAPGKGGSVKLSAAPGQTLYLLCAIHPWMQAKITVK